MAEAGHAKRLRRRAAVLRLVVREHGRSVGQQPRRDRHPREAAADRARRVLRRLCRQEIQARRHPGRERRRSAMPRPGWRPSSSRAAPSSTAAIPRSTNCSRSRPRSSTATSATRSSRRCSSWSTRRRCTSPIWQLGFINGVGPRVGESAFDLIAGFAYTAPFEDITIKSLGIASVETIDPVSSRTS